MAKAITSLSGRGAYHDAKKKAHYGHHPWIHWTAKGKEPQARKLSEAALVEMMLEISTQQDWYYIGPDGVPAIYGIIVANRLLARIRAGESPKAI